MAVVIPFSPADATINRLVGLSAPDMLRVNSEILARTVEGRPIKSVHIAGSPEGKFVYQID